MNRRDAKNAEKKPGLNRPGGWLIALVLGLLGTVATAQDITQGHTFVAGETVTPANMNAIAGSATINSTFYTGKSSETGIADNDGFLVYSPSLAGFRQITWASLALTNAELVSVLFGTSDFSRRSNFLAGVDEPARSNFLNNASSATISNFFLLPTAAVRSNFLFTTMTNLPVENAPTNKLAFLVYNPGSNAVEQATMDGLFTNLVNFAVGTPAASDQVELRQASSGILGRTSITNLKSAFYTNYSFSGIQIPVTAAVVGFQSHGFAAAPQVARWVLVCTNAAGEAGWVQNDEVDATSFRAAVSGQGEAFYTAQEATHVILAQVVNTIYVPNKATFAFAAVTPAKWVAKCYLTYFY